MIIPLDCAGVEEVIRGLTLFEAAAYLAIRDGGTHVDCLMLLCDMFNVDKVQVLTAHFACARGWKAVCSVLDSAAYETVDEDGRIPTWYVGNCGHEALLGPLVEAGVLGASVVGHDPGVCEGAASAGRTGLLKAALKAGADLAVEHAGRADSALHCACRLGPDSDGSAVEVLLAARADPNLRIGAEMRSPLLEAIENGSRECVERLLSSAATRVDAVELIAGMMKAPDQLSSLCGRASREALGVALTRGRARGVGIAAQREVAKAGALPDRVLVGRVSREVLAALREAGVDSLEACNLILERGSDHAHDLIGLEVPVDQFEGVVGDGVFLVGGVGWGLTVRQLQVAWRLGHIPVVTGGKEMSEALLELGVEVGPIDYHPTRFAEETSRLKEWLAEKDVRLLSEDPLDALVGQALSGYGSRAMDDARSCLEDSDRKVLALIASDGAAKIAEDVAARLQDAVILESERAEDAYARREAVIIVPCASVPEWTLGFAAQVIVFSSAAGGVSARQQAFTLVENLDPEHIASVIEAAMVAESEAIGFVKAVRERRDLSRQAPTGVLSRSLDSGLADALQLSGDGFRAGMQILTVLTRWTEQFSSGCGEFRQGGVRLRRDVDDRDISIEGYLGGLRSGKIRLVGLSRGTGAHDAVLKEMYTIFLRDAPWALQAAGLPYTAALLLSVAQRIRVTLLELDGDDLFGMRAFSCGDEFNVLLSVKRSEQTYGPRVIRLLGATGAHEVFHNLIHALLKWLRGLRGAKLVRAISAIHFRTLKIGGRATESGLFFDHLAEHENKFNVNRERRAFSGEEVEILDED